MSAPIEQKAVASPVATLVFGYLTGLLIQIIPWLKDNLTADQKQNLPVVIAFFMAAVAGYFAPHTSRPDLAQTIESVADAALGEQPPQPETPGADTPDVPHA